MIVYVVALNKREAKNFLKLDLWHKTIREAYEFISKMSERRKELLVYRLNK